MRMKYVVFRLPERQLEKLDKLVAEGLFPTRSEALRTAVLNLLRKHRKV